MLYATRKNVKTLNSRFLPRQPLVKSGALGAAGILVVVVVIVIEKLS